MHHSTSPTSRHLPTSSSSLSRYIYAIIGLFALGLAALSGFFLLTLKGEMLEDRKHELKVLVEAAQSLVKSEYELSKQGKISEAEAKANALAKLATLRYGNNDYIWVNDMTPRMIMHPMRPELNGKDLTANKDPNGKALFMEFVSVVKKDGAGFVDYEWPRPGAEKPQPKLSYVAGFAPWGWVVGTGVYIDDLNARFWKDAGTLGGMGAVLLAALVFIAIAIAKNITASIKTMTQTMIAIAQGETRVNITGLERKDELGVMAAALCFFRDNAGERDALVNERLTQEANTASERKKSAQQLADQLDSALRSVSENVARTAKNVDEAANELVRNAVKTQESAANASRSASATSDNVGSVAAATEEMSVSVREINDRVSESSTLSSQAVVEAQRASEAVRSLNSTSEQIGQIVSLIRTIADQTNLLALNATIEAARAGEAGKGFAVVAGEVKSLATQTGKATEQISEQITEIQNSTNHCVSVIDLVGSTIDKLSQNAQAIAAAIEQQSFATTEISSRMSETAGSSRTMTQVVEEIDYACNQTGNTAQSIMAQAKSLSAEADRLRQEINTITARIRAA